MAEISDTLKTAISAAIIAGVSAAANSPTTDLTARDTLPVSEIAVEKAIDEIKNDPVVVNATNSEPWWQSRVVLSAIGGEIAAGAAVIALAQQGFTDVLVYAGPVTAFVFASINLYGRLKTGLKPLFS